MDLPSIRTMEGRRLGKARLVWKALFDQPRSVIPYVRSSLSRSSPLESKLPWFSFSAIEALEELLTKDMLVYEYGSGGSTLFFASRVRHVVSVESDERWAARLRQILDEGDIENVDLRCIESVFDNPASFASSDFAQALPDEPADLVVLDSFDLLGNHPFRPALFPEARRRLRSGGALVLDDSWRYRDLIQRSEATTVEHHVGLGPGRRTVTSTSILHF